jgi:hypothetical protein
MRSSTNGDEAMLRLRREMPPREQRDQVIEADLVAAQLLHRDRAA